MPPPGRRGHFATTQWSLVLAVGQEDSAAGREALEQLCRQYWFPVFTFVRQRGYSREEAEDLTQGFFTRLVEKGVLGEADRSRGRFRSFLLTACRHYLSNERDRRFAKKRGGGTPPFSLDVEDAEQRYGRHLARGETPETVYERQWTLTLLDRALGDLRDEYDATGRGRQFERLKPFLTGEDDAGRYAETARALETTDAAVKVAVHRLRRRYRKTLRSVVAATTASEDEVDAELAYCFRVLSRE